MSYVNPFTEHAVHIPLRLFIEYGLRQCREGGRIKLKTEVREGPKNATQ